MDRGSAEDKEASILDVGMSLVGVPLTTSIISKTLARASRLCISLINAMYVTFVG